MTTHAKEVGIIGLGNMGGNIAKVLHKNHFSLVLYDQNEAKRNAFTVMTNARLANDLQDLVAKLHNPNNNAIVWAMVPADSITGETVKELGRLMRRDDIVIDGSNSKHMLSKANYELLKLKGINYLDVGVAGGPNDIFDGVALMVGGDRTVYEHTKNIFKALSGNCTYGYVGENGSGHELKGIINAEYYASASIKAEIASRVSQSGLDKDEAMRLIAASPITTSMWNSLRTAVIEGNLPPAAKTMKVSDMVRNELATAKASGIELPIITMILLDGGLEKMSEDAKKLLERAKYYLTGH